MVVVVKDDADDEEEDEDGENNAVELHKDDEGDDHLWRLELALIVHDLYFVVFEYFHLVEPSLVQQFVHSLHLYDHFVVSVLNVENKKQIIFRNISFFALLGFCIREKRIETFSSNKLRARCIVSKSFRGAKVSVAIYS